jgi:hypothetical protein
MTKRKTQRTTFVVSLSIKKEYSWIDYENQGHRSYYIHLQVEIRTFGLKEKRKNDKYSIFFKFLRFLKRELL